MWWVWCTGQHSVSSFLYAASSDCCCWLTDFRGRYRCSILPSHHIHYHSRKWINQHLFEYHTCRLCVCVLLVQTRTKCIYIVWYWYYSVTDITLTYHLRLMFPNLLLNSVLSYYFLVFQPRLYLEFINVPSLSLGTLFLPSVHIIYMFYSSIVRSICFETVTGFWYLTPSKVFLTWLNVLEGSFPPFINFCSHLL